jgi:hypothetical protein
MGVASHCDGDTISNEQPIQCSKFFIADRRVAPARKARMPDNGHDEFAAAAGERTFEPCPLSLIDAA